MFEISPEEAYPGMYRVVWPDGVKSADFYNWDRAKDHAAVLASTMARQSSLEARG